MKRDILFAGVAMLILSSCSDKALLPGDQAADNAEPTLTIIATQGDSRTRVAYDTATDGIISLTWTEGDAIYVTEADSPTNLVELTLTDGAGTNKGTFTTTETLPEDWTSETELVSYYKSDATVIADGMIGWVYEYPEYFPQIQTTNSSTAHLAGFNQMVSKENFTLSDGITDVKFAQMGAIMEFSLSGLGGKTITRLKLVAESDVFMKALFMLAGSFDSAYSSSTSLSLGENGAGIVLDDSETLTAYIMTGVTELTEGQEICLYATDSDGNIYSASVSGGKIEAGKFYSLGKAMKSFQFFNEGDGSETSPYMIASADDLKNLHKYIMFGNYGEGEYFKLKNDIDLSNECGETTGNWLPRIGPDGNSGGAGIGFKGTFDGDGHTISGLYFNDTKATNIALFGCITKGGTVKNLNVEGNITAMNYSAGVVAKNSGGSVSGCTFTGTVNLTSYGAGGIIGFNTGGTVIGCSNSGSISSTQKAAGGIVGYMNTGYITACYNTGAISGANNAAGGIAGNINYANDTDDTAINACYNTSENLMVGTVTNYSIVSISNCYWASSSISDVVNSTDNTCTVTAENNGQAADWSTAMTAMNNAISSYGWKYVENTDESTKTSEPLKLQRVTQ